MLHQKMYFKTIIGEDDKRSANGTSNMSLLMDYPRLIIYIILLSLFIFLTVDTFIGYNKNKYNQLYYSYGFLIMSIAFLLITIQIIITEIYKLLNNYIIIMTITVITTIIGLFGFIIILIGYVKERNNRKTKRASSGSE